MTKANQEENDKMLISLVEAHVDVSTLKKKKALTDEDRAQLLSTLQTLTKLIEPSMKQMKAAILKKLNYSGHVSYNPYLSKDETRYIYNSLVLRKED